MLELVAERVFVQNCIVKIGAVAEFAVGISQPAVVALNYKGTGYYAVVFP